MWKNFFTTLAAVLLGGGGLGYYFRDRWTHRLSIELEKFKTKLAADLFERQTKIGSLHTERVKVLIPLHRMFRRVELDCRKSIYFRSKVLREEMSTDEFTLGIWSEAQTTLTEFEEFYEENEAVLGDVLVKQLRVLTKKYWNLLTGVGLEFPGEAGKVLENEVVPFRQEIQKIIQQILGAA